jgi:hypothetical protein
MVDKVSTPALTTGLAFFFLAPQTAGRVAAVA